MNFCFSNGWWGFELKYVKPIEMASTTTDCRKIPGGIRYFSQFANVTNTALPPAVGLPLAFPPPEQVVLFACWLSLCPNPELPLIDARQTRRFLSTELQNAPNNKGLYAIEYLGPQNAFLSSLRITNDGVVFLPGGAKGRYRAPYQNGFLESEYKVVETTNLNGSVFPLRAVLRRFSPKQSATSPDDLFEHVVTHLTVEEIDMNRINDLRRHKTPLLVAFDKRPPGLPNDSAVNYIITNDLWNPATDREIVELAAIKRQMPTPRTGGRPFAVSLVVIITILAMPVAFLIWWTVKHRYNK